MKNKDQKFKISPFIKTELDSGKPTAENLSELCERIKWTPTNICHCGAASDEDLEYMEYVKLGAKAVLLEPAPDFVKELEAKWGGLEGVTIFPFGIYKKPGNFTFVNRWASTCLTDLKDVPKLLDTPVTEKDKLFKAQCILFDGIDSGNFDLVVLDTQGTEYFALERMKSRPRILQIETHYSFSGYKNPYLTEIFNWALNFGYLLYARNGEDSVFLRSWN